MRAFMRLRPSLRLCAPKFLCSGESGTSPKKSNLSSNPPPLKLKALSVTVMVVFCSQSARRGVKRQHRAKISGSGESLQRKGNTKQGKTHAGSVAGGLACSRPCRDSRR